MTFVPFSDGVEVVFSFRVGGQTIKNVMNFIASSLPDVTNMAALGKVLIDAWLASDWWGTALSNKVSFEEVKLTSLVNESAPTVTVVDGTTLSLPQTAPGSVVASTNNVALVVTHRTDSRGRSFRGRSYLAGIRQGAFNTPVEVDSAYVTMALSLLNSIAVAALTEGAIMAVFSRQSGGVIRTTGVATPIGAFACNPASDSQRRRLEGRGS
jgi:hypothetical protein